MWRWMIEFLSKFQSRDMKIYWVNLNRIAKPLFFFNILRAVTRKVTARYISLVYNTLS